MDVYLFGKTYLERGKIMQQPTDRNTGYQQGVQPQRQQRVAQHNQAHSRRDRPGVDPVPQGQRPTVEQPSGGREAANGEQTEVKKTKRTLTVIGDAYARTAWLFMYDVLDIGKVYFRIGYHDGDDVAAYADAHKLRVPLHDLFQHGYMNPKLYDVACKQGDTIAKIDIYGGSTREGVTSTIVTITDDPGRRMPVSITVSSGPGILGEDGDIRPKRGGDRKRVSISMSRQEARTMAGRVLGHYAFWAVRKRQYVKPKIKKGDDS